MPSSSLNWIEFKDFTPGIHDHLGYQGGIGGPFPLGAATRDQTYRCIGLPKGGLGPLPKRTSTVARAAMDSNALVTYPVGQFYITGFYVNGPVLPTVTPATGDTEMFFSFEYLFNNAGTPQRRYRLERYRAFADGAFTPLKSINSTETGPASEIRPTIFGATRSKRSAPTTPGIPIIVAAWYSGSGGNEKFVSTYPNDATPALNAMFDISTTLKAEILTHQGRVLMFGRTDYSHGVDGAYPTNEDIYYTPVNDVGSVSAIPAVFVPENPSGYGVWASMSANELFLIKWGGGALTVMGDIADPAVTTLPNVVPSGGLRNQGTSSVLGFVYGVTDGGAWVWSGGDSSENMSPQLDGTFWQVPETQNNYNGCMGVWARWAEWVCAPNNWLYDTGTKAWWRLEDTAVVQMWNMQANARGTMLWGAPAKYTDATTPIAHGFQRTVPANSYSWKSHPIAKTIDRQINVRELVLVVQGTGTVTVTLTGRGDATRVETFSNIASNNYPTTIRKNTQMFASHVTCRIESNGGVGPAPIVYELKLGVDEKMREPAS